MTEQITRPATLDDLKALLRSLNANGVDYLLIGGYALAAHGYQRATTDIDIVFPATAAAGQRVKDALMILPDQAAKEIEPQWFEEGENIRVADAFVVDIGRTISISSNTIGRPNEPIRTSNLLPKSRIRTRRPQTERSSDWLRSHQRDDPHAAPAGLQPPSPDDDSRPGEQIRPSGARYEPKGGFQ